MPRRRSSTLPSPRSWSSVAAARVGLSARSTSTLGHGPRRLRAVGLPRLCRGPGRASNALILHRADLDAAMVSHNPAMLEVIDPHLLRQRQEHLSKVSITDQVRWALKRLLAGQSPDVGAVSAGTGIDRPNPSAAHHRGRRQLPTNPRRRPRELVRQYLADPALDMNEVAYLLGYDDTNSFYRAFRSLEGTTPARWRSLH